MIHSHPRIAPGPPGHFLLGNLREFRRDLIGLMMEAVRAHGDVVRFRLGPKTIHLLNHPDHVEHVLQKHSHNYDKQTRSATFIKAVTGESVLASNGECWKRQRRLVQPAFHHQHIAGFANQMAAATNEMLESWRARHSPREPLDIASEMMRLTYTIVGRTLFSFDAGPDAAAIEGAMRFIMPITFERIGRIFNWPGWVPTPENRRFRRAIQNIDQVVYRIIEQHRRAQDGGQPDRDLLSMLLRIRDGEMGAALTDRQLRNETITFLLAGHETTANALTWAFYLLSQNPEVEQRLQNEITIVLAGRIPTLEDISRLNYTKAVLQESMRLYPPNWLIERRVIEDDMIDDFQMPAGSAVVIAPYTLHRHRDFWDRPEEFDPSRFIGRSQKAYIPFGAGQRFCIGQEFAMLEAQLIVAMVLQSFRLRLVPGHLVEPLPGILLRAKHGMLMTLSRK